MKGIWRKVNVANSMGSVRVSQGKHTVSPLNIFDKIFILFEIRACHRCFIIGFWQVS